MDIQDFVLQRHHVAEMQSDVASHHDVAVMRRRGLIERACGFGTPVDEHGVVTFVGQADTPDVQAVALRIVETSEDQPILHAAQLYETILIHGGEGVAFGALRGRAMRAGGPDRVKRCFVSSRQCVQSV